ncbi:DNA polymerase Y family protein [Streptacidiphilus cavernicola]|uniref:DNA polymerase Y family protein n=1 Tax=Streptacidiphilus cavernicola TaxID=3342716 RepID=A0ABV6VPY7_9ACTN
MILCCWVPDWPVLSVGRPAEVPVAVVAGGLVVACSASARARGVRRRMRVRVAQSRCSDLLLVDRDVEREVRLFEPVVRRLERDAVPQLEVLRPGLVAMGARGPARYWGGLPQAAERLVQVVAEVGYPAQVGAAETLFAAALAVRRPSGVLVPAGATASFLSPFPVTVLGRGTLTDLLMQVGIATLGDLAALPASRIQARFGSQGVSAQCTALGLEVRPISARGTEEHQVAVEFEEPETRVDALVFGALGLADRLHGQLEASGLVCARVEVRVDLADQRSLTRLWRHEGRLSALALAERVRGQVRAWAEGGDLDTATPAAGVTALVLRPAGLSAAIGTQTALFGGQSSPVELERAAARVQALLGHHAVVRQQVGGGRGPGERVTRIPFGDVPARRLPEGPWPGRLPAPHPATVFETPLAAQLLDAAGRSVRVSGRVVLSAPPIRLGVQGFEGAVVTGWAGPWPVLEGWWDRDTTRRVARVQVTTAAGRAWLVLVQDGRWWAEAHYG